MFYIYYSIRFLAYNFNKFELNNGCFSSEFYKLARALFSIIPQSGCCYAKDFYNLMSVFALVKLSGNSLRRSVTFYSYWAFSFEFFKIFINSHFQKSSWVCFCDDLLSAKRKVGKKKVLEVLEVVLRNLFRYFSPTSSSITINL